MSIRFCLALAVLCGGMVLLTAETRSQDLTEHFAAHRFESGGRSLSYRLMSPHNVDEGKKYPLVVFLHGAGERGVNNNAQLRHVALELATDVMRQRHPAFVIAPQCPTEGWWGGPVPTRRIDSDRPLPTSYITLVLELISSLEQELPIDPSRLYITGLSMGGYGTWEALLLSPDRFAAAAPICGAGKPDQVSEFKHVPIWVFHGGQDATVPVQRSREMIDALRASGGRPIYTEYPGVGHDSWTETAKNRLFWDWMFAQHRGE